MGGLGAPALRNKVVNAQNRLRLPTCAQRTFCCTSPAGAGYDAEEETEGRGARYQERAAAGSSLPGVTLCA